MYDVKSGERELDGGEKKGGDRLKKAEKREDTSTGIIQNRIGRRSCRLRDRTQNDVEAPPGPGTTHRRQNKCTCGRVRMVVVAVAAGVRAETTRMMRKTNESSTVSTLSMTFGRWEPVGIAQRRCRKHGQHTNSRPSDMAVSQTQKGIRDRRKWEGI